ncbi:hypothetical protein [Paenibacillus larvae]|uniref:hypothetical protein n=1 Tax=Paenibacillus larvae TaxID=1464 RepID=UPI00288D94F2|nr:hypothetical protein [Paenibacillus larvae]MDT2193875.1 hypothetical protein [Paenibacillus larvae]
MVRETPKRAGPSLSGHFLKSKIDMVKDLNTELVLSSDEINQLAKKEIAKLPNVRPDVRITGADFQAERK